MSATPRPQDDEAIAAMCRWLQTHKMVALGTRSGKLILLPAEQVYGPEWTLKQQNDI